LSLHTDLRHEDVLYNLGIAGHNFAEQNEGLASEMTWRFLEYAKLVRVEAADPEIADRRHAEVEPIEVRMTSNGFPIIPKLVIQKELKKGKWEKLLRAFLTQYYLSQPLNFMETHSEFRLSDLASGQKLRQVPYRPIKKDTTSFVKNEYQPPGMILQDPRNMHLDDI
jgi:hypothetical protein